MSVKKFYIKIRKRINSGFQNGIYKHVDEYSDEGTRIVRINDYDNNGSTYFSKLKRVRLTTNEIERFSLKNGDILINRVNSLSHIGKSCIIEGLNEPLVFESNMMRLRLSNASGILPEYLYVVFNSTRTRDFFRRVAKPAVAQASINQEDIKFLSIYLPKLEQQKSIAKLFFTWDLAIRKTESLIAAKEKQKQAFMKLLLTGRKRLAGFTNKWRTFQLGELFTERREAANDHLPLLSITRDQGVISRNNVERKDTSSEDKSRYLHICTGDIGYNTMRMWQGVSALSSLEGIVSPAYTICIPNKYVDGLFMAYLFKLREIIHLFYRYSQGLTSDTWNLKFHHFRKIKVCIPDYEEQKAIAELFSTFDLEINLLRKKYDLLNKLKRGLMQKLLTGQWRIKYDEEEKE